MLTEIYGVISASSLVRSHKFDGREINCTCLFCGDSQKDPRRKRLYIGEKEGVPLYNCFNCQSSGAVDINFLTLYSGGVFTPTVVGIGKSLATNFSNYRTNRRNFTQILNVPLPTTITDYYNNKMFYFEHRTGLHPIENQKKYRIIYSIRAFMEANTYNDLSKLRSYDDYFLGKLDERYIGFLDATHSRIIFRVLPEYEQEEQRLFSLQVSTNTSLENVSYYHSVGKIELNKLEVNYCEGIFDCINLETMYKSKPNQLFVAVLNKDYSRKVIEIYRTYGLYISKLNFYLDKDHNTYFQFKEIINKKFSTFYKNTIDKDFGEITKPFKPYVVNKVIEMIPSLNDKTNWKKR